MKAALAIFGLILGLLIMENSWGSEPAYQRECRIAGGIYWSVSVNDTLDTPLCRLDSSVIGAADFAEFKWNRSSSLAVAAYARAVPQPNSDVFCASMGARLVMAGDSQRDFWRLCQFPDKSIIGDETLARGPKAESNGSLSRALGL